jgi:hypothetical protein
MEPAHSRPANAAAAVDDTSSQARKRFFNGTDYTMRREHADFDFRYPELWKGPLECPLERC